MPFGKYRGKEVVDIEDTSYLKWAEENTINPKLREELQLEIERREGKPKKSDSQLLTDFNSESSCA